MAALIDPPAKRRRENAGEETPLREAIAADENFHFVQLADSQLGMLNADDDPDDFSAEIMMLEAAVSKINAMDPAPAFVIVCGDLIHEFPQNVGGSNDDPARAARAVGEFKRITAAIDAPCVCVCGNHDVGNVPTRAAVDLYRGRFGADYGEFDVGAMRCIVLNSSLLNAKETFWRDRSPAAALEEAGVLAEEQDAWLAARKPKRTLVFSHIPPFLEAPDEPKGYFNHEEKVRRGVLEEVKRLDPRAKWFCGHFHRNAGGWDGDLEVVVTSAVGCALGWNDAATREERLGLPGFDWAKRRCDTAHSGVRCVRVSPDAVTHKFFVLDDVPADVPGHVGAWAGETSQPASWGAED